MPNRCPVLALTVVLLSALVGCESESHVQANAPPQGYAPEHPRITHYFVYHNDQGMMADLSIADMHYIPHTTELSGAGEARLGRYAELLAMSGGTIHYDTLITDEKLTGARLAVAKAFLADTVPGARPIDVVLGGARGPGMRAQEAAAGAAVAEQPEQRGAAYHLTGSGGGSTSGG